MVGMDTYRCGQGNVSVIMDHEPVIYNALFTPHLGRRVDRWPMVAMGDYVMRYHLIAPQECLQAGNVELCRAFLRSALACANRDKDNIAKASIMRALNYARRV